MPESPPPSTDPAPVAPAAEVARAAGSASTGSPVAGPAPAGSPAGGVPPPLVPVLALFFVSGVSALVYEVAWVRMLGRLTGHSSYAVTAVLSAYMGGLAAGSLLLGRAADRSRNPLALYGKLEIGAGLAALAVPFLVDALTGVYASLYRQAEGAVVTLTVVRFVFALAALAVPTFLLGGTFPALASAVVPRGPAAGRRAGLLYGINTAGAVVGTLAAGFVLLGSLGTAASASAAAFLGIAAGVAALALARGHDRPAIAEAAAPAVADPIGARAPEPAARAASEPVPAPAPAAATASPPGADPAATADSADLPAAADSPALPMLLLAAAIAGFAGLAFEVLCTRLLAMFFASITYAFSAMLAVFLAGIALGGLAGGLLADALRHRSRLLGGLLVAAGLAGCLSLLAFRSLGAAFSGVHSAAFGGEDWWGYVRWLFSSSAAVMAAPTLCLGAIFPLLLRCAADRSDATLGESSGRIYAANTFGAILGPPVAMYLLLPVLGTLAAALVAVSAVPLLLGAWLIGGRSRALSAGNVFIAAAVVFGFWTWAAQDTPAARTALFGNRFRAGQRVLYHEEGPTVAATVVEQKVQGSEPRRFLYTDSFLVAGVSPDYAYMRMLGHLPALLAPERRRALVVGFGTGTTAGSLSLHPFDTLDIVEISPEVLRAAVYFDRVNQGVASGKVSHPEVRIFREDGRNHLLGTESDYDVITAEPPLPYLAGAVNLYSRDFYAACRERLSPSGVVCQWMPLHGTRPEHYRQMLATFRDVFPDATLWYFRSSAIAIGTMRPLAIDYAALADRLEQSPRVLAHLAEEGLGGVPAVLAGLLLDARGYASFVAGASVVTDDRPTLEYFGAGESVRDAFPVTMRKLLALRGSAVQYLAADARQRDYYAGRIECWSEGARYALLGYTLEMEGQWVEAAGVYQEALAKNPEDRGAKALYQENVARLNKMGLTPPKRPGEPKRMIPKLEGQLADLASDDTTKRMEALYGLGERGDREQLPHVLEKLDDPVAEVRLAAVWAVGKLGGPAEVPRLERIAAEGNPAISVIAFSSLAALGEEKHLDTLRRMVRDVEPRVRAASLAALLEHRDKVTWEFLDASLKDRDAEVRKLAIKACGVLKDAARIPALQEALKTTDWPQRAYVATALGEISRPEAVPVLLTVLEDSDPFVRKKAGEALKKATGESLPFDAEADDGTRAAQAAAWRRWWEGRGK